MTVTSTRFTPRQMINAWCMYDWANSAFATTILAAVLPVYYSQVAAAGLPSATATAYWGVGLSVSLAIVAVLSPILGTISDVVRSKKRFLTAFALLGTVMTALLVLVDTGDWLMASVLFVLARIGFTGANVFYDALLPHIVEEEEQDAVSTRGFAMGYLGGGVLLAINVGMIELLPGTWGPRLSFVSVALWWALFTLPLLRRVPEPPAATATLQEGENVLTVSFGRLAETIRDIRRYRDLFLYLVAFLIYNDAIGTIIGMASIYGAELGFGSVQLILALLLVQFVGIPFSLIFGRLPNGREARRPIFLAFILFNLVAMPVAGIVGARVLPQTVTGARFPAQVDLQDSGAEAEVDTPEAVPESTGNLGSIMALILGIQAIGAVLAFVLGPRLFTVLAETLDTKRTIVLALVVYVVVAVWGFVLNSVIEFWMLAWMVAVVQGGSQALSRSLYAKLSPAAKSGEFFGLFGVMEKFSAILGPLLFAGVAALLGSSRPAILSLILLFAVGIVLLSRVDVEAGIRVARAEDTKAGIPRRS
jgi:UMF1 family MFS transporter